MITIERAFRMFLYYAAFVMVVSICVRYITNETITLSFVNDITELLNLDSKWRDAIFKSFVLIGGMVILTRLRIYVLDSIFVGSVYVSSIGLIGDKIGFTVYTEGLDLEEVKIYCDLSSNLTSYHNRGYISCSILHSSKIDIGQIRKSRWAVRWFGGKNQLCLQPFLHEVFIQQQLINIIKDLKNFELTISMYARMRGYSHTSCISKVYSEKEFLEFSQITINKQNFSKRMNKSSFPKNYLINEE